MRRTVKEARAPSPRLRITTPSKSCVRSFSPSTTLTCTRTVSPGPNPSRSFLSCPASTKRIASMTSSLSLWRPTRLLRSLAALESFHQLPVLGGQVGLRQQVRPRAPRPPQRLRPAPPRDARVVAGQQHRGHVGAAKRLGPRVLRRLQQPARERLPLAPALAAQHARTEPDDRVGHNEGPQLSAREHVVADRERVVRQMLPYPLLPAPLTPPAP